MQKVIDVALAEEGYLEKRSNSSLNDKKANAGSANYTKYGTWYGLNPAFWCAMFVSWCFHVAYGETEAKKLLCGGYSAACEDIRQNFVKKGQYHTSNPQVGDVIFYSGTRHSGANHIGIVYKVSGGKVYTVEGNTSGASDVVDNGGGVATKSYSVNYSKIMGYGRPAYSTQASTAKKSIDEIAREVIAGNWGSGTDREARLKAAGYDYKTVQAKVNEILKGGSTAKPANPTPATSANVLIRDGQIHANNFCGAGIVADGVRGSTTKKAGIKVLQQAMNRDYNAKLSVDGVWGNASESALGKHTVRQGEKQYMVTAVEILLMLKGYNPGGVESPGVFGSGLKACVVQYQKDHGLTADGIAGHDTFKSLIS